LTNITRHAGVTKARVHIWLDKESLNLQITDQGSGFDMATLQSPQESSGLSGMRERARLLGGELVIESTPGAGTSLTAILPLADSKPDNE
jgi:signal transduction histidine kinase